MSIRRAADTMRSLVIVLVLSATACNEPLPKLMIPDPGETLSVSIILYDEDGDKVVSQCVVKDVRTVREIHDCLTPHERSEDAASLMRSGPIIGKLGFRSPRGMTWVEFVDPGKNPLCFHVREKAYLRGGADYRGYRSDHKRLYGIDSKAVDEGMLFYRKLMQICEM